MINQIEQIEISPSDKVRCICCKRLIGKGTPRGIITTKQHYGYSSSYYCYKCTPIRIEGVIKFQEDVLKELNILIKKQTKEILVMELEDENNKGM